MSLPHTMQQKLDLSKLDSEQNELNENVVAALVASRGSNRTKAQKKKIERQLSIIEAQVLPKSREALKRARESEMRAAQQVSTILFKG